MGNLKDQDKKATTNARVGKNKPRVTYSEEIIDLILERISCGESVNAICSSPDMPTRSSFFRWLKDDQSLLTRYKTALETRAYLFAEEIIHIVDEEPSRNANGSMDSAFVTWQKSRVDARKWIVSRMLPKIYGDKVGLTHNTEKDDPLAKLIQRIQGSSLPVYSSIAEDDDDD